MKRAAFGIIGLTAFVAALWLGWTFRSNNSALVDLDLIWIQVAQVELWWLVLMALASGVAFISLIFAFVWLRNRLLLRAARSRIRRLEREIHELRSLPLLGSEPGGADLDGAPRATPTSRKLSPLTERS